MHCPPADCGEEDFETLVFSGACREEPYSGQTGLS